MSLPGQRVLVVPPTRRDGEVTLRLLAQAGLDGEACATLAELGEAVAQGVGAILLTGDVLRDPALDDLLDALAQQPPWSDVPTVIVMRSREPQASRAAAQLPDRLRNAMLLDGSASAPSMLSAVRAALRARQWQYQVRDQLLLQERTQAELCDGDRRKDEFLATLAHELRNPLAPLRTGLAVLRAMPSPDRRFPGVLGMMERQMGLMVRLIDDLLDVARISRGKIELVRQPLELREVVDAALESCAPMIAAARHVVALELAPQAVWV